MATVGERRLGKAHRGMGVAALLAVALTAAVVAAPAHAAVITLAGGPAFNQPNGVAVSPSTGDLYVADTQNSRIQQFTAAGELIRTWGGGQPSNADGNLSTPMALAVSPTGDVYVADTFNQRVQQFTAAGAFIRKWPMQPGPTPFPFGIAVGPNGDVYVVDPSSNRVQQFDAEGDFIRHITGPGGSPLTLPRGVAVDPVSGDVYVADWFNNRIQRFSSAGVHEAVFGTSGSDPGKFNRPGALAVAANGNLYVADTLNNRIQEVQSDGTPVAQWGSLGSAPGQFANPAPNAPMGVAVAPDGDVYVGDAGNHRVQRFSSPGVPEGEPLGGVGTAPGLFNNARGLTIGSGGDLYVADSGNSRIQRFTSAGSFADEWGSIGSGTNQFSQPAGIAAAASGDIYVAEGTGANERVQRFDAAGGFLGTWGAGQPDPNDLDPGEFDQPEGIAVSPLSGEVYVADTLNHRIQRFDPDGIHIQSWGSLGGGDGQLELPRAIAFAANGDLYVAEGASVQQFSPSGVFVRRFGSIGTGPGQLTHPRAITIHPSGNVLVADTFNNRLSIFTANGLPLLTFSDPRFDLPSGIQAAANGDIYLTARAAVLKIPASAPFAPTLNPTNPTGPSSNNDPKLTGSTDPGTGLTIYRSANCSGDPAITGTVSELTGAGVTVNVPADQTTQFSMTATSESGTSACSNSVAYTEDSTAPPVPVLTGTDPASPSIENNPRVFGTAAAGSTVRLYAGSNCAATPVAQGSADDFQNTGFPVTVADRSTTVLRASAVDAAGNVSACSSPLTYLEGDPNPDPGNPGDPGDPGGGGRDRNPPQTEITAGPKGRVASNKARFKFSADEDEVTFFCKLDNRAFRRCESPKRYGKLASGLHRFQVRAVDDAGNIDETPAKQSWRVGRGG